MWDDEDEEDSNWDEMKKIITGSSVPTSSTPPKAPGLACPNPTKAANLNPRCLVELVLKRLGMLRGSIAEAMMKVQSQLEAPTKTSSASQER
eukprot:g24712.t1